MGRKIRLRFIDWSTSIVSIQPLDWSTLTSSVWHQLSIVSSTAWAIIDTEETRFLDRELHAHFSGQHIWSTFFASILNPFGHQYFAMATYFDSPGALNL